MTGRSRRIALTVITAALVFAINIITPTALPPPLSFIHLRLTDPVSIIIAIIDPYAGAIGSVMGHFLYDYMTIGFPGAIAALFASWCFLPYGYIAKYKGKITIGRLILGMIWNVMWLSSVLSCVFTLIFSMPFIVFYVTFLISITIAQTIALLVCLIVLPRLEQYVPARIELDKIW